MKINKKLLLIKAHFFFTNAGAAPVMPSIPIIAKNLGFSSLALGWIFSVYPVVTIFLKPFFGSIADTYKAFKSLFILLLILRIVSTYSIQYMPSLPYDNSVIIKCNGELSADVCLKTLKEECYAKNVLDSLNSTQTCKIQFNYKNNDFQEDRLGNDFLRNDKFIVTEYSEDIRVILDGGLHSDECISLYFKNETKLFSIWTRACFKESYESAELFCETKHLKNLLNKPMVGDKEVSQSYQYWLLFVVITTVRVTASICSSIGDTICFALLGDVPENYGLQRMWGAVGWGLMSFISGYLVDKMSRGKSDEDYSISFYFMLIFFIFDIIAVSLLTVKQSEKSESIAKDVKNLFNNLKMWIFTVWCTVCGIYTSLVWNFLFWFIEELASKSGCNSNDWIKTLEGLVLTVHTYGGEIPFFFLSGKILRKIGHLNAMSLVLFAFGIRFILFSSLVNPWWILPIEGLNGITFGIFYATMTTYASVISPPGAEATVQNLVGAMFEGVGAAVGALLGGYLFEVIGSSQTFFVAGVSAIIFALLLTLSHKLTKDTNQEVYRSVRMKKTDEREEVHDDPRSHVM